MKKLLTIFFIFLLFNIPAQADDIASGLDPAASDYIVTSSYANGNLVRS